VSSSRVNSPFKVLIDFHFHLPVGFRVPKIANTLEELYSCLPDPPAVSCPYSLICVVSTDTTKKIAPWSQCPLDRVAIADTDFPQIGFTRWAASATAQGCFLRTLILHSPHRLTKAKRTLKKTKRTYVTCL